MRSGADENRTQADETRMKRMDGRDPGEIRPVTITPDFIPHAEGSVLIEVGRTRVICTATVEETVPRFVLGSGRGWITAEYAMLPRATASRTPRESSVGKRSGRTLEIQRLIGRSLRTAIDLSKLGERTIRVDCDVIEADGGTRTASITGAFVAVRQAIERLVARKMIQERPIRSSLAAVSVGIVRQTPMLDLNYSEDSSAEVDLNVVMTDRREFVEIQGTAEREPFPRSDLDTLLELAESGILRLIDLQDAVPLHRSSG
jgi:ribonuclease PH